VEISISAVGEEIALDQFCHWLREDVDIARAATISRVGAAGAGHMGTLETICMTVSNATGLASLAITYANWRKARKNPPTLTFTVSGPLTDELRKALDQLNRPEDEEKDAS
jgi:membrane-associated two-gene conflict system component 1 (EACC1)